MQFKSPVRLFILLFGFIFIFIAVSSVVIAVSFFNMLLDTKKENNTPAISYHSTDQDSVDSKYQEAPAIKEENQRTEHEDQSVKGLALSFPPPPSILRKPLTGEACEAAINSSPFYRDPKSQAAKAQMALATEGRTEDADVLREISCFPQAAWIIGGSPAEARARVEEINARAADQNKIALFVLYNIPSHTTPAWRSGLKNEVYRDWVGAVAQGIGIRRAWIVLEPDALPLATGLSLNDQAIRLGEIRDAVEILKKHSLNVRVYLDAGHSFWKTPDAISALLLKAGIARADGFIVNVSNYQLLPDELIFGRAVSARTGNTSFIVDTSRNGNGPPSDKEWCNARGRALGLKPTIKTGEPLVDAYLWIKPPGESDGDCNGGPPAGKFWLEYALDLARNAL